MAVVLAVAPGAVAAADVEAGRRKAEVCVACHGPGGNAVIPGTPSLSGMPAFYTHWQLNMYRDGRRRDPQMTPFAERLSDEDMANLSAYYAAQAAGPPRSAAAVDAVRAEAGRPLAERLHCTSCHGPTLMGQQAVPRLAGQDLAYLDKRLRGYKSRTTSDLDGQMTAIAQPLSEGDIAALVHFMAGLTPRPAPATPGVPGSPGGPARRQRRVRRVCPARRDASDGGRLTRRRGPRQTLRAADRYAARWASSRAVTSSGA